MIKITILTGKNSRNAGGLFYSVKSLSHEIESLKKVNLSIVSHNDEFSNEDINTWDGLKMLIYSIIGPTNFGFSRNLKPLLENNKPDIIHQQGIWSYASNCSLHQKKIFNTKTIITPRGMLDSWAINNSKLKKKVIGNWFEYENLRAADCIHALNHSEYRSIRKFGLKNPVAIIPNGIFLPKVSVLKKEKKEKKTLLFISRIHPKKGLDFILEVFKNIIESDPSLLCHWEFRIGGWAENGHRRELEKKCNAYNLNSFIKFIGPVYNQDKEKEFLNANAFILPSYSEGLPMSVLEAWSYKLPVIMTKECNLPEGFESKSSVLINHTVKDAAKVIVEFLKLEERELQVYGENGYNLVKNNFTWSKIATQTLELYSWLLTKRVKPNFIKLD